MDISLVTSRICLGERTLELGRFVSTLTEEFHFGTWLPCEVFDGRIFSFGLGGFVCGLVAFAVA